MRTRGTMQQLTVIGTHAREHRHVVSADQYIDRIDLEETETFDDPVQVNGRDGEALCTRAWSGESLSGQRDSSGLCDRKFWVGHSTSSTSLLRTANMAASM